MPEDYYSGKWIREGVVYDLDGREVFRGPFNISEPDLFNMHYPPEITRVLTRCPYTGIMNNHFDQDRRTLVE